MGGYTCEACTTAYVARTIGGLVALSVLVLALAAYAYVKQDQLTKLFMGSMTSRRYTSLENKGKILFVMEQMAVGMATQIPAVALPTSYAAYLANMEVLSLDMQSTAERACLTPPDFYMRLVCATALPIAASLCLVVYAWQLRLRHDSWSHVYGWFLMLTYCVFPTASQTIFQLFACDYDFDRGDASRPPRGVSSVAATRRQRARFRPSRRRCGGSPTLSADPRRRPLAESSA